MDAAPAGFANRHADRNALGGGAFRDRNSLHQIILLPGVAFTLTVVATVATVRERRALGEADLAAYPGVVDLHINLGRRFGHADRFDRSRAAIGRTVGRAASMAAGPAAGNRLDGTHVINGGGRFLHRENCRARLGRHSRIRGLRPRGAGAGHAEQGKQDSFHIELHFVEKRMNDEG